MELSRLSTIEFNAFDVFLSFVVDGFLFSWHSFRCGQGYMEYLQGASSFFFIEAHCIELAPTQNLFHLGITNFTNLHKNSIPHTNIKPSTNNKKSNIFRFFSCTVVYLPSLCFGVFFLLGLGRSI